MGLSLTEAKMLGLEEYHPAMCRDRGAERELLDRLEPAPPSEVPDDGMNKTERRMFDLLRSHVSPIGLLRQVEREPITVWLPGRVRYIPDFGVWPHPASDWRFTLVETKGYMREDSAVRIKVAAGCYPNWRWLIAYRSRRSWEVYEADRNGIGREPIIVRWIHGD